MALTTCWHCGDSIYPIHDTWETTEGIRSCHSGPDDEHVPVPVNTKKVIDNFKRGVEERRASSASYCAGCHSKFPSSQGFPHTQSGETLIYCPVCSDNGEVMGKEDEFSVSAMRVAGAPSLDLACNLCGEESDPGDDNETDLFGGVGETCPNCNKGKLKLAGSAALDTQDNYEGDSMIQADDMSALTPDVAEGIQSADQAPRSFKAPKKMMREQVNGLDKNGDGIYPRSHKIASYEDVKKHLIQHHGFKNDWLTGYNEKDLMRVYDTAHKNSAYGADHEHPVSDYTHQNMITSSKVAGDIVNPPSSYWTGKEDDDEYPKSITLINNNNRHDWSPMSPFKSMNPFNRNKDKEIDGIEHNAGEFNGEVWHYKPKGMVSDHHGSYEKFYGTMMNKDSDSISGLDASGTIKPANVDGNSCKECGESHGWKWELTSPQQKPLIGSGLEPVLTYDENGKKQKVEGHSPTREEAALELDKAHHREFVQPIKKSNIDFNQ